MRRHLFVLLLVLLATSAIAATPTSTPTPTPSPSPVATTVVPMGLTTNQHTMLQNTFLSRANAALCARYNLPSSCTTANVITAGCVPKACQTLTKQDSTFTPCTIYSLDATGEAAYSADRLCLDHITQFLLSMQSDYVTACLAFNTGTTTFKNQVCTDLGQANGCAAYPASCGQ